MRDTAITTQEIESKITVTFKQFLVEESLAEYYFYKVECRPENPNSLMPNSTQLPYNSSLGEVSVTFDGLTSGTSYIINIIPYREVAQSNFGNAKLEAGIPSQNVMVTGTLKNKYLA